MGRTTVGVGVLLALALVGGCGGGGEVARNGGPPPAEGATVSLGTLQVGVAAAASFRKLVLNSPGTSRVAFTALYGSKILRLQQFGYGKILFTDGNYEINVMDTDGSGLTNLTNNGVLNYTACWSPDAKKIAFGSRRADGYGIYVMNANGSGQTRLTTNTDDLERMPAWSPDGRRIAFVRPAAGLTEIYVMNADGSGATNLTNDAYADWMPSWSPDGRQIAYSRWAGGNDEIHVMSADGSRQTNLTNHASTDQYPSWSPDGRRIAFVSDRDGLYDIYVMSADGSGPTRLTNSAAREMTISWSPDGRRIAFDVLGTPAEIYVMNADGSGQTRLTNTPEAGFAPSWCPAPSVMRTLIGAAGADGGANPPFGTQRPLVVVGLNADGLVSATSLYAVEANWGSLAVSALNDIGTDLAGLDITGTDLRRIDEDMGRGLPRREWLLTGSPATGAVSVFFSGETGKVASIIASADTVLTAAAPAVTTQAASGRVVLTGSFHEAYSAQDRTRNLVAGVARQIALDSHTGEVVAVN